MPILVKLVSSLCSEFIHNYFWIQLLLVYTAKVGNTVAISIWLISNYYTSFLNIWTELFWKIGEKFLHNCHSIVSLKFPSFKSFYKITITICKNRLQIMMACDFRYTSWLSSVIKTYLKVLSYNYQLLFWLWKMIMSKMSQLENHMFSN